MKHDLAGCFGKFGFETQRLAGEVAKRMSRRGRRVHTYRCCDCKLWHVGNSTGKRKKWRRTFVIREGLERFD